MPKTIPKRRLAEVGGRVFSKKEIMFWRITDATANIVFIGNAVKFSSFLTASIFGKNIVNTTFLFSSTWLSRMLVPFNCSVSRVRIVREGERQDSADDNPI